VVSELAFLLFSFLWACHAGRHTRLNKSVHGSAMRPVVMNMRWAGATAADSAAKKWGRSSPTRCFDDAREQSTELNEAICAEDDTRDCGVNVEVNARVNSVFDDGFTRSSTELPMHP
jgi:hypothetical protein